MPASVNLSSQPSLSDTMPVTLDEYAKHLQGRSDLRWPAAPPLDVPKVRPHLPTITGVRAVLWNVYGTLLAIAGGEQKFESDNELLMNVALDKTIQEFKMWASMSRKPGQPAEYMREIYRKAYDEQRLTSSAEKVPEILAERIWESITKKLFQKEYKFDAGYYGSLNDYSKKIAYFFHASLQGTECYEGAAGTIGELHQRGITQGLLADGQCFTAAQVGRALGAQDAGIDIDFVLPVRQRFFSFETKGRKPSDTLFERAVETMGSLGYEPSELLHVGSSLPRDIAPAKKWGMRTALFAGDRQSLVATGEQLKDPQYRPDALLTELGQVTQLIS